MFLRGPAAHKGTHAALWESLGFSKEEEAFAQIVLVMFPTEAKTTTQLCLPAQRLNTHSHGGSANLASCVKFFGIFLSEKKLLNGSDESVDSSLTTTKMGGTN